MKYYINKNLILGTISANQKTVTDFVKEIGISRPRFYLALNAAYTKPRSRCISKIAKQLGISEVLIWQEDI